MLPVKSAPRGQAAARRVATLAPAYAEPLALAALALAWLGIWGPWIPHRTVAMTQHALDLADWSAFLLDVRAGPLAAVPDILRLAVALTGVALALGAAALRSGWLRWLIRLVVALASLVLLPPYPAVLDLWHAEVYRLRLIAVVILWAGIAISGLTDRLKPRLRRLLVAAVALGADGLGLWAFFKLRPPFVAHYTHPIAPGWGAWLFALGLAGGAVLLVVAAWSTAAAPEKQAQ